MKKARQAVIIDILKEYSLSTDVCAELMRREKLQQSHASTLISQGIKMGLYRYEGNTKYKRFIVVCAGVVVNAKRKVKKDEGWLTAQMIRDWYFKF